MIHQKLVLTSRIKMTYFLSVILTLYIPALTSLFLRYYFSNVSAFVFVSITLLLFSIVCIPIWVGLASLLLNPFYTLIKKNLQHKAKKKVYTYGTRNIMIVGSYGKTTIKNFINQLIQYSYRTQMTSGNINTPTGIALWLLNNLDKNTQVLVAETDGYKLGEVADCCKIIPADIVVITYIGDQHLERLKNKKTLARTLLEAVDYSKINSKIIIPEKTVKEFNHLGFDLFKKYKKERFVIIDETKENAYMNVMLKTSELSVVNRNNLNLALKVCELLNIPINFIEDEVSKLVLPERRNQEILKNGFTTIDNSYNISFNTAKESILNGVKRAKELGKKLIVITGGIPELGKENADANRMYGKFIEENSIEDVILLKTNLINDIVKGLGYEKVRYAISMEEAWKFIYKNYDPSKYIVLMQPELNDLYYADMNLSTISVE